MAARLSPQEKLLLEAFVASARGLVGARLSEIMLFGSRARGEGRDDSDLDVLVAVRELTREDRLARAIRDEGRSL